MAVKKTAAQAGQNWGSGFAAAGPAYEAGIQAVTTSPGTAAAAQVNAYVAGVNASKGIWQAKMLAMDLATWKNAAITTGSQRLQSGAQKGQQKITNFFQQFIPDLQNIVGNLPARGTYEQNMARSRAFADALHAKKGSY